jgi:hypothetical protein
LIGWIWIRYGRSSRRFQNLGQADSHYLARFDRFHLLQAFRYVGQQVGELIRLGTQDDDRQAASPEILLVFHTFIRRHENLVLLLFGEREKLPISSAGQSSLWDRSAIVIGQMILETARQAFVDQNSHPNRLTTRDFASSKAEIAADRVTVGKSSRNSSRVWPPSR